MNRVMPTSVLAFVLGPFLRLSRRFLIVFYIARRALLTLLTLFLIGFVFFGAMSLSGHDMVDIMLAESEALGDGHTLTSVQLAYLRAHLGLEVPWHAQYFRWLGRILRGDFDVTLAGRACHAKAPQHDSSDVDLACRQHERRACAWRFLFDARRLES